MFGRVVAFALVLLISLALVLTGQLPLADSLGGLALDVVAPLEELVSGTYRGAAGSGRGVQTVEELEVLRKVEVPVQYARPIKK